MKLKSITSLNDVTLDHVLSMADAIIAQCPLPDPRDRFILAVQEVVSTYSDTGFQIQSAMNEVVDAVPVEHQAEVRKALQELEVAYETLLQHTLTVCLKTAEEQGFRRGVQAHAMAMVLSTGVKE